MLEFFRSLLPSVRRDEDGASAVEYGLLVAGIAALVVAVVVAPVTFWPFAAADIAQSAVANGWISGRYRISFGMALTGFPILFTFTAGMLLLLRHVNR